MHIISTTALKLFYQKYPDAESSLRGWYKAAKSAKWQNILEVRQAFNSAALVGELTVFNIQGNKYRLITYIDYQSKKIFIRNIITHTEYDTDKWKNDPWFK
ncbi:MAG: type II toxin-antitoxin system HigB family toxin [Nostoc sp. NOS(2021)]|uniref:type II toxin-antitoxin system HigB family toxin n=1 Tax=Nostoc sp. NOS(2021) TaxID=2815407 RepID=UPI0025F5A349|nr:type II toxin-antitoxin system HigB family toxin [Nostoc sp. NOS(2021)]MBN3898663.1 type II toxin-antitoxin system HigB family toxin [Nostoc sp. NOS(2021)]